MTYKIKSAISTAITTLFVFLFTYTAASKILQHNRFLVTLLQSPVLHQQARMISWLLPLVELSTAILLLFKKTQRIGMYITFVLMLVFTGYILYLLVFIPNLPCSCGGILQSLNWKQHFMLNLLLIALALFEILLFNIPVCKKMATPEII